MIRDENEFAKKIRGYLDAGAADLRAGTAYRLQQARAKALARLSDPVPVAQGRLAHSLAGHGGQPGGGMRRGVWLGFGVLMLAALLFGWQQWNAYQQTREIEELDTQILSSDLPIDAYLDRGFQTWLTRYQP
jgi:hypothetical protein